MPCMATIDAQPGEVFFHSANNSNNFNSSSSKDVGTVVPYVKDWDGWYESNVNNNRNIPWGGRLRTPVMPFVSNGSPLLWTRFQNSTKEEAVQFMTTDLFDMMVEHLEIYVQHVSTSAAAGSVTEERNNVDTSTSRRRRRKRVIDYQNAYMDFWRYNEPERTTLRTLYGDEWS
eukprot:CAMPEP_0113522076 /NCGR_PEP_ID=MMETSP0014_2-20120614/44996_1 /TAXON_ID=2857 /ORGANISM="Nitzschia sp." /LENGTH=172 /DNA_ID=CAMNT_0000420109 /DNA_START=11 /DNA_END=525 /DNA_ORIENTATION=+ /assembly_acc=CAM_ASM_000159